MAKQASTNMLSLAKLLSSINGGLEKYASSFLLNSPIIRTTGASPSFSWYKEIAIKLSVEKLAVVDLQYLQPIDSPKVHCGKNLPGYE